MALTEKQQEKVQVCETNWIRRIAGCVERMWMKNWQRDQIPESGRKKAVRKTENAMGELC